MCRALTCLAFALCLLIGAPWEASAADLANPLAYAPPVVARSLISEIRGGVFAHAVGTREDGSVDINGEILFSKPLMPADPLMAFLVPRLHLGTTINTAGDTSQFYAGFTWTYDLTSKVFVEASIGAAFHTGETGRFRVPDRLSLGCSPLIRGTGSVGYRFNENWSIMATVEHISNANLCHANQGMTNYGVRVGYTF
ncbi:MAG: acyloxyacyl hydrolase [Bosea sp.]|nr:acyloxyacyl hydrolase [Bosea sp. (in: a-proteobacteria)]